MPPTLRRADWHQDTDLGQPLADAAAEVVADWARAAAAKKWAARKWQLERAEPQVLSQYGHTRESFRDQTALLVAARAGDETARRELRRRHGCTVYQADDLKAWR